MAKNYFYITFILLFFISFKSSAQDAKQQSKVQELNSIEGLILYPNPVSGDRVYISTKNDYDKEIQIFDILGKKVLQTVLGSSRELNITTLSPGIYIIRITEEEASTTRKLIVR